MAFQSIDSTLYFIGRATDQSNQLMRFAPSDTTVSEALYLLKPTLNTYIRNLSTLDGKGYFLCSKQLHNQIYPNGTGLLVEFDTTATAQYRILNSQIGIDTILPSTYLASIDSALFSHTCWCTRPEICIGAVCAGRKFENVFAGKHHNTSFSGKIPGCSVFDKWHQSIPLLSSHRYS